MADHLLDEFSPVSKQEWLDKVVADLKGKPYEKLVRNSESGIPIHPIYTAEDLPEGVAQSFPGMNDLRRGDSYLMEVSQGGWLLCQDFGQTHFDHFEEFKQGIEAQPWNGRVGLRILLANGFRKAFDPSPEHAAAGGLVIQDWSDLEKVVAWAEEKEVMLFFESGDAAVDFVEAGFLGRVSGGLDLNPLNYFREGKPDESLLAELLPWCLKALKNVQENPNSSSFKLFTISLQELELAGANATQQIAFALAMATELLDRLTGMGAEADEVFRRIAFQFPITTDFFGEMAKIRAFRLVWGRMLEAWKLPKHAGDYTYVVGVPAISNETVADPHVNLLRHTTQAMSAALGGCVTISLPAYDAQFEVPNEDALRIARNIQLVLKEEAYLSKVIDPAGGAYFVESLTDQLAAKAWTTFQEIEAAGGWLAYLKADRLAPRLSESLRKRMAAISTGAKTILGTNHFPNEKETVHSAAFLSNAM
ncbi:MAG TPA: methylmalonyl-CoA mutase family protein, partial [Bacteroidia bacterium]|nr:methylmalonyl-CoA mutase family protein [Bacteroidia bacterium]